jgi:hypothetical protein
MIFAAISKPLGFSHSTMAQNPNFEMVGVDARHCLLQDGHRPGQSEVACLA